MALKLNKFCNDESNLLLNIKQYFNQKLFVTDLYCIDLYDHLTLRKNILSSANSNFWFAAKRPIVSRATVFNFLLPTFSFFEDNHLFISLENRFQTAQRVFSSLVDGRSPQEILGALFFFNPREEDSLFAFFVGERLAQSNLLIENLLLLVCRECLSSWTLAAYPFKRL